MTSAAARVPNYDVSPLNADGSWNVVWWRFFAGIAAQFSGKDPSSVPVDPATFMTDRAGLTRQQSDNFPPVFRQTGREGLPEFPPSGVRQSSQDATQFPPQNVYRDQPNMLPLLAALGPQRATLPVTISDTIANQGKYPASTYPNTALFVATDTKLTYYTDGTNWILLPINTAAAGTYGDSTHVAQITEDANGRISVLANVAISFPSPYPLIIVPAATLPGGPAVGQIAAVNTALAPVIGAGVTLGGAAFAAVMWNGAQWTVFSV